MAASTTTILLASLRVAQVGTDVHPVYVMGRDVFLKLGRDTQTAESQLNKLFGS